MSMYAIADTADLVLMSYGWRYVDHAEIYECAVEAAFPFRGRCEVGFAALFKKARARGKNLVQWQAGLLQSDGPKKSDIQVGAPPRNKLISAAIQSFDGIECAELAPRVYREL